MGASGDQLFADAMRKTGAVLGFATASSPNGARPSAKAGLAFVGVKPTDVLHPFRGAVDEVKYFGDDLDTGHAMSYSVDYLLAEPGQALAFPLFRKGSPETGGGDTSGIQIFNTSMSSTQVKIMFFDLDGDPALAEPDIVDLGPLSSYTAYTLDYPELPVGFTGSAVVQHEFPPVESESGIVAISNLVNYDVQYDGSASFNATMFGPEFAICGGMC
jgi:hypothetical protein